MVPTVVLGALALGSFGPKMVKVKKMESVREIAGAAGSQIDPLAAARAKGHDIALFGAGCFWGIEAQFRTLKGVEASAVGFSGGSVPALSYKQVCNGGTGQAEVVMLEFDPKVTTYETLVRKFYELHSPTMTYSDQYRSAIFTYGPEQARTAEKITKDLTDAKKFSSPIVTQIAPATAFWKAEDYHQQYYEKKGLAPESSFCAAPEK